MSEHDTPPGATQECMHLALKKDTCLINTYNLPNFLISCGNNMSQGNERLIVHAMATSCVQHRRIIVHVMVTNRCQGRCRSHCTYCLRSICRGHGESHVLHLIMCQGHGESQHMLQHHTVSKRCRNVRAIALHVGSRTQKAVRAHLKKMDASRAAVSLSQQQMHADEATPQAGQAGASPEQVCSKLSVDHHASVLLSCMLLAGE